MSVIGWSCLLIGVVIEDEFYISDWDEFGSFVFKCFYRLIIIWFLYKLIYFLNVSVKMFGFLFVWSWWLLFWMIIIVVLIVSFCVGYFM